MGCKRSSIFCIIQDMIFSIGGTGYLLLASIETTSWCEPDNEAMINEKSLAKHKMTTFTQSSHDSTNFVPKIFLHFSTSKQNYIECFELLVDLNKVGFYLLISDNNSVVGLVYFLSGFDVNVDSQKLRNIFFPFSNFFVIHFFQSKHWRINMLI